MSLRRLAGIFLAAIASNTLAQTVTLDTSPAGRQQVIDGFGTCLSLSNTAPQTEAWQKLYLDEFGASMVRTDLVPFFKAPWSDLHYYSPWFKGKGQQPYGLNFETTPENQPRHYSGPAEWEWHPSNDKPEFYNGPDGNRARTYTSPGDYSRDFAGYKAPIAVMGPNIDDNIERYFNLEHPMAGNAAAIIAAAKQRGIPNFKLVGSIWSLAPWLKMTSGGKTPPQYGHWPFAREGTPYPYIATDGNFVGGRLDTSAQPLAVFDDSALPADSDGPNAGAQRGPTSALTQFARSTAAYLRAFQKRVGAPLYAVSIQNEINFETHYHSCTYPLSSQYIAALKAVRAELDKYDDLRQIQIMGPEDLLSDATHSLWQYGGGDKTTHKNLQYLTEIAKDPEAQKAIGFFCIHGYAPDGVSSAGADPVAWQRWAEGWETAPAGGLPEAVKGFTAYGKKSWMTETSGERGEWLAPGDGFPGNGAWSIALKMHQALTVGRQSAWLYWQFPAGRQSNHLTALKHYTRFIRPNAVRVEARVDGENANDILASAYLHEGDKTMTLVLLNRSAEERTVALAAPTMPAGITGFKAYTSKTDSYWQESSVPVADGKATLKLPAYCVMTLINQ